MTKSVKVNKSALYMLMSAVLFSLGGLFVKTCPWSAMAMNSFRNIFAFIVVYIFFSSQGKKVRINKINIIGGIAYAVTNIFFVMANKLTTAANAIVLQFTLPIFIILFSWLFLKQKPLKNDLITCSVVFAGVIIFFLDGLSAGNNLGNVLALVSGMSYAIVFMLKSFDGADTYSPILIGQLICIAVGLPFIFFQTDYSLPTVFMIVVQGIVQVGLAFIFFIKGLENTPPVTAAIISTIEPVLNPLLVALFYHESVSTLSLIGAVIVVLSIAVYNILNARAK